LAPQSVSHRVKEHGMGLFCASMHFRGTDDKALSAALNRRRVTRYRVIPDRNGWTSLYEERVSRQDDDWIRDLAGGLSQDLHVAAIAFLVHDSDVACYWLYDNGQLLDSYNSCPDYFDDHGATEEEASMPSGGQPDVLVRYCRTGVRQVELTAILAQEAVFAEGVIERLAEALGIDRERALADYKDIAGGGPGGTHDGSDDGDGGLPAGGPDLSSRLTGLTGRLTEMLGLDPRGASPGADPRAMALVQAAVNDNTDEIDRLLAEGAAVDAEAPAPLPGGEQMASLGHLFPGGAPTIAMTPLLATIVNKRRRAAERLLDGGADPNRVHRLFGTPVHAATSVGEVELLQLLIDRGGDVTARNAQRQTPLQILAASRATRDRMAQAQAMARSMGIKLPGIVEQIANVTLPTEGWDACERLLKAQGKGA
jgi:hypothetical protein